MAGAGFGDKGGRTAGAIICIALPSAPAVRSWACDRTGAAGSSGGSGSSSGGGGSGRRAAGSAGTVRAVVSTADSFILRYKLINVFNSSFDSFFSFATLISSSSSADSSPTA
jgi:hypothetical protein